MTHTPNAPDDPRDGAGETWESLARYWSGEGTPAESDEMRRRLAERPADGGLLDALDQYASRERSSLPGGIDVEAALARVHAKRTAADERKVNAIRAPGSGRGRGRPVVWRVAIPALAATAVFAAATYAWNHRATPTPGTVGGARVVRTGIGERDSLELSDGSHVLLAPGTELSIPVGYGTARRELELRGEAQFRVRHDDALPFVVRAGNLEIQDVGTVFTVRSVASDSAVVSVSEGAVRLRSDVAPGEVELHAGDVAATGPASGAVVHRGGASDLDVAWTRGKLLLRDASLETVVYELHRWYGINLRVDDPVLQGRHYTATFDATSKPDEVLAVMRTLWDATMEHRGDTVVMRRSGGS